MNGCFFSFFCKSFDCSSLYILQVWLIEVNINPAMQTNCDTLKQILPGLIEETLGKSMTDILSLVQSGYLRLSGNWTDIVQLFPYILDSQISGCGFVFIIYNQNIAHSARNMACH